MLRKSRYNYRFKEKTVFVMIQYMVPGPLHLFFSKCISLFSHGKTLSWIGFYSRNSVFSCHLYKTPGFVSLQI